MKLEVNVDKRVALVIFGVMFLLAGGLVYAYGTSNATVFGHSAGEISGVSVGLSGCYWTANARCTSCTKTWSCGSGEVATAIRHKSTGERHVDYVWIKCCKLG